MTTFLAKSPVAPECLDATSGHITEFREITLMRENDAGMIFISCDAIPDLFIAVDSECNLRSAIDRGLRNAFEHTGLGTSVYTNGSIDGPNIQTVVKLTK
jgi:hypothetical protein